MATNIGSLRPLQAPPRGYISQSPTTTRLPSANPMIGTLSPTIGAMAYELAARLQPGRWILARYNVSVADFRVLMSTPVFLEMLRKAKQDFSAVSNTADRVRLKSQLLTEMGLEEMWGIIQHPGQPAAARVSAYNAVKTLTGMDRPEEAAPMQKFSLKIVLPNVGQPGENAVVISSDDPEPVSLMSDTGS